MVELPGDGLPPRPLYQASQGQLVARHGTPSVSATTATGLTVLGVELTRSKSTLLLRIIWGASCDARFGSDRLSATTMLTSYLRPPALNPWAYAWVARMVSMTNLSPDANPA